MIHILNICKANMLKLLSEMNMCNICIFNTIFTNSHIIEYNIFYSNCLPNFKKLITFIDEDNGKYFLQSWVICLYGSQ